MKRLTSIIASTSTTSYPSAHQAAFAAARGNALGCSIALAFALGFASLHAAASNLPVTICGDDPGSATTVGTLRYAFTHATMGDTVDMSALPTTCSVITLQGSQLQTLAANLTLQGPTSHALQISGGASYRVIDANGSASALHINDLTITNGKYQTTASGVGGCIRSTGSVTLTNSTVSNCVIHEKNATTSSHQLRGGAIFATGSVTLINSTVSGNLLHAEDSGAQALGAGIYSSAGCLSASYSTISDNVAQLDNTGFSDGGGARMTNSGCASTVTRSTVSGNISGYASGLGFLSGPVSISASTFANNAGANNSSALFVGTNGALDLVDSTIAFNTSSYAAVLLTGATTLQSTIIADNIGPTDVRLIQTATVSGANNLIMHSTPALAGGVVVSSAEPRLVPLSYHGGLTRTLALDPASPAVGQGNNAGADVFDQRGTGFPRPAAQPDIGAYQRQQPLEDEVFYSGMDH